VVTNDPDARWQRACHLSRPNATLALAALSLTWSRSQRSHASTVLIFVTSYYCFGVTVSICWPSLSYGVSAFGGEESAA
jgi:hypothetical protein